MKKFALGIAVSAILLYFTLRGIDYPLLKAALQRVDYPYVWATVVLLLMMQYVRSLRWGLLLAPLERIHQTTLFAITSVGFLAIVAIPARLGELARPYLIAQKSAIPMSSALATIVFERVLDTVVVLAILAFTIILTPLPQWITTTGGIVIGGSVVLGIAVIWAGLKKETLLRHVIGWMRHLPQRWRQTAEEMVHHFVNGFQIVKDGKRVVLALLYPFYAGY